MQRYPFEEYTKVLWVPGWDGIASIAAPTTTELNDAGNTDLSCFLKRDGLAVNMSTAKISDGVLCTRNNADTVGSVSTDPMLRGYRDNESGGDTFWNLAVWNSKGYLVVRRGIVYDTAWASSQAVEVYKASMGEPSMDNSQQDTSQGFDLPLAFDSWDLKAAVA